MYVSAIVLAAGKGVRLNSPVPKPLVKINSQPLVIYCLKALSAHPDIKEIIIVTNSLTRGPVVKNISRYGITKVKGVVLGGCRRQDSVNNGLKAVSNSADLVLIHDGVRPFIDKKMISALIEKAGRRGAAIAGVPVKATIKKVRIRNPKAEKEREFIVEETVNRNSLWEIQTPQVFKREIIAKAHKDFSGKEVTDDAMLAEKIGVKVRVVMGSYNNIKITTAEDLLIAEAIARSL